MTAGSALVPASALRRVVLLAGILAVIAGFLGMHILATSHGMHVQAPAGSHGHSAANHAGAPATAAVPALAGDTQAPPSCGQGGCAGKSAVHIDCTPSVAGISLSAPPPGATVLEVQSRTAALAGPAAGYTFVPRSPSPSDLSISRT